MKTTCGVLVLALCCGCGPTQHEKATWGHPTQWDTATIQRLGSNSDVDVYAHIQAATMVANDNPVVAHSPDQYYEERRKQSKSEQAVARDGLYHQAENEMIGVLIESLYAANQEWYIDRRRIRFHAKKFRILPEAFLDRLESVVQRHSRHTELNACHAELLSLFHDLTAAVNQVHGWRLPTDWQIKQKQWEIK